MSFFIEVAAFSNTVMTKPQDEQTIHQFSYAFLGHPETESLSSDLTCQFPLPDLDVPIIQVKKLPPRVRVCWNMNVQNQPSDFQKQL